MTERINMSESESVEEKIERYTEDLYIMLDYINEIIEGIRDTASGVWIAEKEENAEEVMEECMKIMNNIYDELYEYGFNEATATVVTSALGTIMSYANMVCAYAECHEDVRSLSEAICKALVRLYALVNLHKQGV